MTTETLKAGRELDALVAEKVMGGMDIGADGERDLLPHYSTDIAAAWRVFGTLGGIFTLTSAVREGAREWFVTISHGESHWAVSAPEAICLAALKAVGS